MDIHELVLELKQKSVFKDFIKKYPNAFLTAGFFMMSTHEKEGDTIQLDYYIPNQKKFCSFAYPFTSSKLHDDIIENAKPLDVTSFTLDLSEIPKRVEEISGQAFPKIIAILQNNEWNLTCLSGMVVKRLKINALTNTLTSKNEMGLDDIIQFKA